jgi:diguanylate cyclase (GGDEF)-like protein/PAS domain S-box-containing protein
MNSWQSVWKPDMKKQIKSLSENLRQKAEELLNTLPHLSTSLKTTSALSELDTFELIHELEVHQIELEMQNDELQRAIADAEIAASKYSDLYHLALSGYFTLSTFGEIIELNLTSAKMLGTERINTINRRFGFFVSTDTLPVFNLFLDKVFQGKSQETCEVTLLKNGNLQTHILLTGIITDNKELCNVTMVDITERKLAEDDKKKRAAELVIANNEKEKRANELVLANTELAFQNEEKDKRADELLLANQEKDKRAEELVLANSEKEKRANELVLANTELAFQNEEKDKRADELLLANQEKDKRAEELVLANSEIALQIKRFSAVIDNIVDGVITISDCGVIESFNPGARKLFGYREEEVIGQNVKILMPEPYHSEHDGYIEHHITTGEKKVIGIGREVKGRHKDGNVFPIELEVNEVSIDNVRRFVGITHDITERKQAEDQLKKSIEDLDRIFNLSAYMVCIATPEGYFRKISPAFTETLGFSEKEFLTQPFVHFVHPDDKQLTLDKMEPIGRGIPAIRFQNRYICKDGSEKWLEWTARSFVNVGDIYAIAYDITDRKIAEQKLERIAHYDMLTNLPNRVLLADRLSHAIVQCQRRNQSLAVAFMDLDGFKAVNDTHGHNVGDELLIAVSQRMKAALREGDTLARIGGDEFIAVMVDLEKTEDTVPVLERLIKSAAAPVTLGNAVLQVSASIGVAFYPLDGIDSDKLIRRADQAMYSAKLAGKNRYHEFNIAQDNTIKTRLESIDDIRSALHRREFVLHYQPKVNMHTGEVIGVEALILWEHPVSGLIPSITFLPVIEGQAISLEIGEWVLGNVLSQISQWQNLGVNLPISVNISAYQLQQCDFSTCLSAILEAHPDVNSQRLELEIRETSLLSDISRVSATMNVCHELGVRFALDDFGTGYSSLNHLRHLPAQMIKIDQSFVRNMLDDADDLAIVEGVIGLTKAFRREVIAEGVETIAHGLALLQLGCELAQGYGIAPPMPADDIPEWVSNWKADDSWQAYKG